MANLLVDWLNSFGLQTQVNDLGGDVSNGYVLAELFSSDKHMSSSSRKFPLLSDLDAYSNTRSLDSSMKNFSMLQHYLQSECKLVVGDELISAVIQQKRGGFYLFFNHLNCRAKPNIGNEPNLICLNAHSLWVYAFT